MEIDFAFKKITMDRVRVKLRDFESEFSKLFCMLPAVKNLSIREGIYFRSSSTIKVFVFLAGSRK